MHILLSVWKQLFTIKFFILQIPTTGHQIDCHMLIQVTDLYLHVDILHSILKLLLFTIMLVFLHSEKMETQNRILFSFTPT